MARQNHEGEQRRDMIVTTVSNLMLITDTKDELYDVRVEDPVDEALVTSLVTGGWLEDKPIMACRREGELVVLGGHGRTRAGLVADTERVKQGKPALEVPVIIVRGTKDELFAKVVASNAPARPEHTLLRMERAERLLGIGLDEDAQPRKATKTREEVQGMMHLSAGSLSNLLGLRKLIPVLKDKLKDGTLSVTAAYNLSKMPPEEQQKTLDIMKSRATPPNNPIANAMRENIGATSDGGNIVGGVSAGPIAVDTQIEQNNAAVKVTAKAVRDQLKDGPQPPKKSELQRYLNLLDNKKHKGKVTEYEQGMMDALLMVVIGKRRRDLSKTLHDLETDVEEK